MKSCGTYLLASWSACFSLIPVPLVLVATSSTTGFGRVMRRRTAGIGVGLCTSGFTGMRVAVGVPVTAVDEPVTGVGVSPKPGVSVTTAVTVSWTVAVGVAVSSAAT